jgi:hypothetical protein
VAPNKGNEIKAALRFMKKLQRVGGKNQPLNLAAAPGLLNCGEHALRFIAA